MCISDDDHTGQLQPTYACFATASGCDQQVVCQTHARGETLDLLTTNVPDLVQVTVAAPLGNLGHSSLSIAISMAEAVPINCN